MVTATIAGTGIKNLVDVTIGGAGAPDTITATEGHPFWLPDLNVWVDARSLVPGDWLATSAGGRVEVSAVRSRTAVQTVNNVTVDELHTFYVLVGATPVLVHNCGGAALDDLFATAVAPYGKAKADAGGNIVRGQSNAGRALQKHSDVSSRGSQAAAFPSHATDAERTSVGNEMIAELLTNPGTASATSSASAHYGGVVRDLWHPDGWGARWSLRTGGLTFEGFLAR